MHETINIKRNKVNNCVKLLYLMRIDALERSPENET